ncbi:hypothetical protein C8R43DRAFT_1127310 [Mycena crocata]|nr:hypothetical protein C8R43DRAFT_1127310 [Mycena crocata]
MHSHIPPLNPPSPPPPAVLPSSSTRARHRGQGNPTLGWRRPDFMSARTLLGSTLCQPARLYAGARLGGFFGLDLTCFAHPFLTYLQKRTPLCNQTAFFSSLSQSAKGRTSRPARLATSVPTFKVTSHTDAGGPKTQERYVASTSTPAPPPTVSDMAADVPPEEPSLPFPDATEEAAGAKVDDNQPAFHVEETKVAAHQIIDSMTGEHWVVGEPPVMAGSGREQLALINAVERFSCGLIWAAVDCGRANARKNFSLALLPLIRPTTCGRSHAAPPRFALTAEIVLGW